MPMIQSFDRHKFIQSHPIYKGAGLIPNKVSPYIPKNQRYVYLVREGGFIDLTTILNAGKAVADVLKDNQELIKQGISTAGQISDAVKSVSNTVKSAKELEASKIANQNRKKKEKEAAALEHTMPADLEQKMLAIGQGFATFGGN